MTYAQRKENARQLVINWQADFGNKNTSYGFVH